MTPPFALDLALDGIRLLYRAEGGWTVVGDVSLDAADLDARLATLRAEAEDLAPGRVATELVIPPTQIRYAEIERPAGEPVTEATLRPRLEGLTPLDPDELVFDWEVEAGTIRLAILDRTTLDEAEAFADAHGFRPVAFTARPEAHEFPRDPDFGATSLAAEFDDLPDSGPAFASRRTLPPPPPPEAAAPVPAAALALTPGQRTDPEAAALARAITTPKAPETEADALTLFSLRGKAAPGSEDRAAVTRIKIAAGLGVAALVWLAYFSIRSDGPSDPAAVLSDTPPAVALDAPGLAAPQTNELSVASAPEAIATEAQPSVNAPAGVTGADPERELALAPAVTTPPDEMTDEDPALRYAATGIWAEGPGATAAPQGAPAPSDELYVASIDPVTQSRDAIALPDAASLLAAPRPVAPLPPPPVGTTFETGEDGFIVATPEGAWTPDGIVVALGTPALVPPPAPARTADIGLTLSETAASLPSYRPRPRPGGLLERNERATLGGLSRSELAALRPNPRPQSAQDEALAALDPAAPASDYAVATSLAPRARPEDFATSVATQRAVTAALAEAVAAAAASSPSDAPPEADDEPEIAVATAAPSIPTTASVARQATVEDAIRLRDLNLIGVYGTDGNRRALVRLPSGRYVKVQVGDRLDGGQIAAIGRSELRYVKGGRNITLSVPSG